uniref:UPAR/Ly6 domain-containing protein n=1 Tax=Kryptolebias marmoratus TaxID=37003 RepID=A0A3Q3EVB4_KRYMA
MTGCEWITRALLTNPISAQLPVTSAVLAAQSETRDTLLAMRGLMFLVFAVAMLTPAQGDKEEQLEPLVESMGLQEEEDYLECFRCDLGFWDACYTTETKCSRGERCYTGRAKAADALDIKMLGCARAEECGVETTTTVAALSSNRTVFVLTKFCCDTPFCNAAHKLCAHTLLRLTAAFVATWQLTYASMG